MGDRNESIKWYIGQLLKWRWEGTAWEFAIWLGTVTGDFFFFFAFLFFSALPHLVHVFVIKQIIIESNLFVVEVSHLKSSSVNYP